MPNASRSRGVRTVPDISVCIPTFDRRQYLKPLLESLVAEPGAERLQIVVSDNASTDGTEELCRSFSRGWPQVKYVRQPENQGPDRNFLSAVKHADAEFCWLFGSDDLPRPGAVARVLQLVDTNDPDLLLFDRVWCDIDMRPTRLDRFLTLTGGQRFDTRLGPDVRRYLEAGDRPVRAPQLPVVSRRQEVALGRRAAHGRLPGGVPLTSTRPSCFGCSRRGLS